MGRKGESGIRITDVTLFIKTDTQTEEFRLGILGKILEDVEKVTSRISGFGVYAVITWIDRILSKIKAMINSRLMVSVTREKVHPLKIC